MIVNILIVDDHSAIISGYKSIFSSNNLGQEINFTSAKDCATAFGIITNNLINFDVVILDYSLPAFPEQKLFFGDDLALLVQKHNPKAKIMIVTSHFEAIKVHNIIKKAKPNALLNKNETDDVTLLLAYEKIINKGTYYSPLVAEALTERLLAEGHFDTVDRQIIELIDKGCQIKTIAETIKLSEDTVKKRKSKIKDLLGIDKGSDEDILRECRLLRLI